MMYHRKRLPDCDVTLLSNTTPTPLALVQPNGDVTVALAVVADPRDIPFEWPDGRRATYALSIRGPGATVQPAISGPVLGTPTAAAGGKSVRLRYEVLVQPGDWYAAFRTAVDEIFAVSDYRQSVRTSLTDAVLNMIDLYLDGDHGGWWERAKAPYQIESKNGSTHSSPLLPLSLYRLTGDPRLLSAGPCRRWPSCSRATGPIFARPRRRRHVPIRLDERTGQALRHNHVLRPVGADRPTNAGLLGNRQSAGRAANRRPATPTPRGSAKYLARYRMTGSWQDLAKACELADGYIKATITTVPRKDLGPQPFFFISFVPDWEGLLHLYELTGKRPYLDAAVFGIGS